MSKLSGLELKQSFSFRGGLTQKGERRHLDTDPCPFDVNAEWVRADFSYAIHEVLTSRRIWLAYHGLPTEDTGITGFTVELSYLDKKKEQAWVSVQAREGSLGTKFRVTAIVHDTTYSERCTGENLYGTLCAVRELIEGDLTDMVQEG